MRRYRFAIAFAAIVAAVPLGGTPIGAQQPAAEHSATGSAFRLKTIDQALLQTVYKPDFHHALRAREGTRAGPVQHHNKRSDLRQSRPSSSGHGARSVADAHLLSGSSDGTWRVIFPQATERPSRRGINDADRRQRRHHQGSGTFFVDALGANDSAAPSQRHEVRARRSDDRQGHVAELTNVAGAPSGPAPRPSLSAPAPRAGKSAARSARTRRVSTGLFLAGLRPGGHTA